MPFNRKKASGTLKVKKKLLFLCMHFSWLIPRLISSSIFIPYLKQTKLRVHCSEVLKTPIIGDYKYGWHVHRKWKPIETAKASKLPEEKLPFGLDFESGSISEKQPRLHLHCRQMILPDIAEAVRHLEPSSITNCDLAELDKLDLVAPLPPYMLLSWNILSF